MAGWGMVLGVGAVSAVLFAGPVDAQSTKVGATLRYGSGIVDVPVASVFPDGAFSISYSGFFTSNATEIMTDTVGTPIGEQSFEGGWRGDLAVAYGLWDLMEFGGTLQGWGDEGEGGTLFGAFGRLVLVHAQKNGLGLALGARWLNAPDFGDGVEYAPTRIGVADRRFRRELGAVNNTSRFTFYAVTSVDLTGPSSQFLPRNDWTLTGGWGTGLFREGAGFDWYEAGSSGGWFAGGSLHLELAPGTVLSLESEYNGFDLNAGARLDVGGIQIGAHVLGVNYSEDVSIYRSRKVGLFAAVMLCPGGLCRPSLRPRVTADTVFLPAPPPDTIVRRVESPASPVGELATLCLANGRDAVVFVTVRGDTLVGPQRVAIESLRGVLDWAGEYAEGRAWHEAKEPIDHDGRRYWPIPGLLRMRCAGLIRVGHYQGVPVYAGVRSVDRAADRALDRVDDPVEIRVDGHRSTIYLPVRPGIWRAYAQADPGMPRPQNHS